MRSTNSIRNIAVNIGGQLLANVLRFVCETVFIQMLGKAYLGVSGAFGNLLTLFSLAEMGFGTAIIFGMYKPLAEDDRPKLGALMGLYRRVYHIVGCVVAAAGLALVPFYRLFLKDAPDIPDLTLIYLLYLANSVITYFLSYKQNIIVADQKNYICTLYQYGFCVVQNVVQIAVLILTRNFILYLAMQILFSFFTNFFLARRADRMYPYLKTYRHEKLNREDRQSITKNIRALFLHQMGSTVVNGTDQLVISSLVGVESAGIYALYYLITSTLRNLTSQIFGSITASVGNLGTEKDREKSHDIFLSVNFAGFWIFSFCFICLLVLFNPFIVLWTRRGDTVYPMAAVFLIALNFYATGMRQATLTFKTALGLFWYDRYKAVVEAAVNLVLSILLTLRFGVVGVFAGTLVSTLAVDLWVEPLVLYRHGFRRRVFPYFLRYAGYGALTAGTAVLTWAVCAKLPGVGVPNFLGKCAVCLLLPNAFYLLLFRRTREFRYLMGFVRIPFRHVKAKFRSMRNTA